MTRRAGRRERDVVRAVDPDLVCPSCHGSLIVGALALECRKCGCDYPVVDGIPKFAEGDAFYEGRWESMSLDARGRAAALGRSVWLERLRWDYSVHRERFFTRHMRDPGRVLDLGCAAGAAHLRVAGPVFGADLSHAGPARAVALAGYERAVQARIGALPFQSGSFHYVVSLDVMGHLDERAKEQLLDDSDRLLAPGGTTIHAIETLGFVRRWARNLDPALFERHLVRPYGHIGLEEPRAAVARFVARGWRIVAVEPALHFTIPGWLDGFDNEFRDRSRALDASVRVAKALMRVPYAAFVAHRLLAAAQAVRARALSLDGADAIFVAARRGERIDGG
jgi:SAM-dependent methyltransferase